MPARTARKRQEDQLANQQNSGALARAAKVIDNEVGLLMDRKANRPGWANSNVNAPALERRFNANPQVSGDLMVNSRPDFNPAFADAATIIATRRQIGNAAQQAMQDVNNFVPGTPRPRGPSVSDGIVGALDGSNPFEAMENQLEQNNDYFNQKYFDDLYFQQQRAMNTQALNEQAAIEDNMIQQTHADQLMNRDIQQQNDRANLEKYAEEEAREDNEHDGENDLENAEHFKAEERLEEQQRVMQEQANEEDQQAEMKEGMKLTREGSKFLKEDQEFSESLGANSSTLSNAAQLVSGDDNNSNNFNFSNSGVGDLLSQNSGAEAALSEEAGKEAAMTLAMGG